MDTELAYLAGFFDGEGCVSIGKSGKYYHLMVTAAQINPEPLIRFQNRFGGYLERKRDGRGFRATHQWRASSSDAVAALTAMLPYMIVKRAEAELALRFQERMGRAIERTPQSVANELAEREAMYSEMRDLKHLDFSTVDLPPSARVGRKSGRRIVRLTAGRGTGPNIPARHVPQDPVRLAAMHEMRRAGKTYEAIGAAFGIKRAAAHHILKRWPNG